MFTKTIITLFSASTAFLSKSLRNNLEINIDNYSRPLRNGAVSIITSLLSDDYGCWCHFSDSNNLFVRGYGSPVDSFDTACQRLSRSYTCLKMDFGLDCASFNKNSSEVAVYQAPTLSGSDDEDSVKNACRVNNPGLEDCELNTCYVESINILKSKENYFCISIFKFFSKISMFVIETIRILTTSLPELSNKKSNGFNPERSCQKDENAISEIRCCGNHPSRLPYRYMLNGMVFRSCCGLKTYDPSAFCCSSDTSVRLNGSC